MWCFLPINCEINVRWCHNCSFESFIWIIYFGNILGPAYNEKKDAKETAHYQWMFEIFNIAVNDFDSKKPTPCNQTHKRNPV